MGGSNNISRLQSSDINSINPAQFFNNNFLNKRSETLDFNKNFFRRLSTRNFGISRMGSFITNKDRFLEDNFDEFK